MIKGPDYFRTAAKLETKWSLEQNKEFHASTSQNPGSFFFAWESIFFFILSQRSCKNLTFT